MTRCGTKAVNPEEENYLEVLDALVAEGQLLLHRGPRAHQAVHQRRLLLQLHAATVCIATDGGNAMSSALNLRELYPIGIAVAEIPAHWPRPEGGTRYQEMPSFKFRHPLGLKAAKHDKVKVAHLAEIGYKATSR
jgi:hypothetical protein